MNESLATIVTFIEIGASEMRSLLLRGVGSLFLWDLNHRPFRLACGCHTTTPNQPSYIYIANKIANFWGGDFFSRVRVTNYYCILM